MSKVQRIKSVTILANDVRNILERTQRSDAEVVVLLKQAWGRHVERKPSDSQEAINKRKEARRDIPKTRRDMSHMRP